MQIHITKYIIVLLLSMSSSIYMFAQDISGEWNGVITQAEGGLSDEYYFSIFIIQDGEKITGYTKVELVRSNKRVLYARKKITGTFKNRTLTFKEIEIVEIKNQSATNICLISGKLKLVWDDLALCLDGTWGGKTTDGTICSPGKVKVCNKIPIAH